MSPLFRRRSAEEKAADQEDAQARAENAQRSAERAAASLSQLEAGHIPLAASERLAQFAQSGTGAFSSDLTVSEWSALERLGASPITQVMGSSIYHVGWQPTYFNVPTEVQMLSDAYNECRRLALGRLLEEAQACGADAVVAVQIDEGAHDWAAGAVEFIALGTAVRLPPKLRGSGSGALLTDLTCQEYVLLCNAGMRPVGIAAHTSVHYVPATYQTQMAQSGFGASWANQELGDFTRGVYEAREKAVSSVTAQARSLGGHGVVGVDITQTARTYEVRRGIVDSKDLEVTFHVMGTVIREDPALAAEPAPEPVLQILSLR